MTTKAIRQLTLVEINAAKNLSRFLQTLPKHALHSFPELDMQEMSFADSSIDVIIHSDTLEHVADSKAALTRMPACFEIGRSFVLHCADCYRSPHPNAAWITTELSRNAGSETRRLRCANRIRR